MLRHIFVLTYQAQVFRIFHEDSAEFGTHSKDTILLSASFSHSCFLPLTAATEECAPTFRLIHLMLRGPFFIPGQQQQLDCVQISLQEANPKTPDSAAGLIQLDELHNIHITHKIRYTERITR